VGAVDRVPKSSWVFYMSDKIYHDLPAPPLLCADRETIAEKYLALLPNYRGGPVDIAEIVRSAGVEIIERTWDKMGDNEAFARPQISSIFVRPGFKDELKRKIPETLFKLAHEFAHVVLHRGVLAKPLKLGGNISQSWLQPGEGQEGQAWDLARAIMLPGFHLHDGEDILRVAADFNAPPSHVSLRLAQLRLERRKKIQPIKNLPPDIKRVWDLARKHPEYNADYYRLSDIGSGSLVEINSFNRFDLPLGWLVDHGRIYWKDEWCGW
jgi:hypothetical protein